MIILHLASRLKPVNARGERQAGLVDTGTTGNVLCAAASCSEPSRRDNLPANLAPALALLQHSPRD
jgi:hypothetical protein